MASEDFEFQLRAQQEFKEGSSDLQQRSGNKQTYVDPSDGTVYEWDEQKRGWFPMVRSDSKLSSHGDRLSLCACCV